MLNKYLLKDVICLSTIVILDGKCDVDMEKMWEKCEEKYIPWLGFYFLINVDRLEFCPEKYVRHMIRNYIGHMIRNLNNV